MRLSHRDKMQFAYIYIEVAVGKVKTLVDLSRSRYSKF